MTPCHLHVFELEKIWLLSTLNVTCIEISTILSSMLQNSSFNIFAIVIPKEGLAGGAPQGQVRQLRNSEMTGWGLARKSYFWYDNNKDLKRHIFTARDSSRPGWHKASFPRFPSACSGQCFCVNRVASFVIIDRMCVMRHKVFAITPSLCWVNVRMQVIPWVNLAIGKSH